MVLWKGVLFGLVTTAAALPGDARASRLGVGGAIDGALAASLQLQLDVDHVLLQAQVGWEQFTTGELSVGSFRGGGNVYGRVVRHDDLSFLVGGGISFRIGEGGVAEGTTDAGGSGTSTELHVGLGAEYFLGEHLSIAALFIPSFALNTPIAEYRGTLLTIGREAQITYHF